MKEERWISALVIDHDLRHSKYTHEHFVATLLLALDTLGPRHWTVKFMASLLLENANIKCCRGITGLGSSMLCLLRCYVHWAEEVVPAEYCTVEFVGTVHHSVKALLALKWQKESAALARRCVRYYEGVWGPDDTDTVFLQMVSAKMKEATSFLEEFSWETLLQEIAASCFTDHEGGRDDGRIARARKELHHALESGCDPLSTYHMAMPLEPECPTS